MFKEQERTRKEKEKMLKEQEREERVISTCPYPQPNFPPCYEVDDHSSLVQLNYDDYF